MVRGDTQTYIGALVAETCCNCGVLFGLDREHQRELIKTRRLFYCPSGHGQSYRGESDAAKAERLARELAAARDREETLRQDSRKQWRLRRAAEGRTKALKRRVANGVCPCCTRTFQNLAAHMKSQHPGFPQDQSS